MPTPTDIDAPCLAPSKVAPRTPWITAGWYLLAAAGPIPLHYWLRSTSTLPESAWEGSTPFDSYFGPGLIYYGAAGLCAWRLIGRRAEAARPAWLVALWAVLSLVSQLWSWTLGHERPDVLFWMAAFSALMFTAFAVHVTRLAKRGSLHTQDAS